MPLFAAIALDTGTDSLERRAAHRDAHRAYVWGNDAPIRLVGPFLDDDGNQSGSFYIFEAESADEVHAWLDAEPFAREGVYGQIIVRRFETGLNRIAEQDWPVPPEARITGTAT